MIQALIRLARPRHWIKNVFILLPLPFAIAAGAEFQPRVFGLALLGFCLINSAVYVLNDILDAEADRLHPKKRQRPIANGEITQRVAILFGGVLLVCGCLLCLSIQVPLVGYVVFTYLVINVLYSWRLRNIPLLDVFLISSGFVLRVCLGCFLVGVEPSKWLLLCSGSLALFLSFAKRQADLTNGVSTEHRPVLAIYTRGFLDQSLCVTAAVTLMSYSLYAVNSDVLQPGREMASLPFVAFGVLTYLRLLQSEEESPSPVEIAFRSGTLQLLAIGWAIAVAWSLK